jgi:hypothetical protein
MKGITMAMNDLNVLDLAQVPCKSDYLWERKETGETILGFKDGCILNKKASKVWDLIDEKNSIQDIIGICSNDGMSQEEVIRVILHLKKTGSVSYLAGLWE